MANLEKVTYDDKVDLVDNPTIPETNKIMAVDMNTIKACVNAVIDVLMSEGYIDTSQLANASVTNEKLASGSVTTEKLADLSVTRDKLADKIMVFVSDNTDGSITVDIPTE